MSYLIEVLKQKNYLNFLDSTASPFEMHTLGLLSTQWHERLIFIKISLEVPDQTPASLAHPEQDFEERNYWKKPKPFHRQVFHP